MRTHIMIMSAAFLLFGGAYSLSKNINSQKDITPHIEIYTKPTCIYCAMAKKLFGDSGIPFVEIDVIHPDEHSKMLKRAQRRTVPQIFINNQHVGGFSDLIARIRSGDFKEIFGIPNKMD